MLAVVTSRSNPFFPRVYGTKEERFWAKVMPEPNSGCWLWCGDENGAYGSFSISIDKKSYRIGAHRFSYELLVGPIPDGMHIDHLCRTPFCVNPDHLQPVWPKENTRRIPPGVRGNNQIKTHCKAGHELSGENLGFDNRGHAKCKECSRLYDAAYRQMNPRRGITNKDRIEILLKHTPCACGCGTIIGSRENLRLDHKIALSHGGPDTNENMQPLTKECHDKKTFGPGGDFRITTRGSDIGEAARTRDIKATEAIHAAAIANKKGDYEGAAIILASVKKKSRLKPKKKILSPGFPKGRIDGFGRKKEARLSWRR